MGTVGRDPVLLSPLWKRGKKFPHGHFRSSSSVREKGLGVGSGSSFLFSLAPEPRWIPRPYTRGGRSVGLELQPATPRGRSRGEGTTFFLCVRLFGKRERAGEGERRKRLFLLLLLSPFPVFHRRRRRDSPSLWRSREKATVLFSPSTIKPCAVYILIVDECTSKFCKGERHLDQAENPLFSRLAERAFSK